MLIWLARLHCFIVRLELECNFARYVWSGHRRLVLLPLLCPVFTTKEGIIHGMASEVRNRDTLRSGRSGLGAVDTST